MEEHGFVEIKEEELQWPIGQWSDESGAEQLGRFHRVNWLEDLEGFSLEPSTRGLGRSTTRPS